MVDRIVPVYEVVSRRDIVFLRVAQDLIAEILNQ